MKLDTFVVVQRSKTLDHGVCTREELVQHSKSLLEHLISQHNGQTLNIRLLGIRVHNFVSRDTSNIQSSILSFVNKGEKELRPNMEKWQCPICARYFPKKLNSFNKHVDKCTGECGVIDLTQQSECWTCPICNNTLPPQLVSFNKHVDKCLDGGSIPSVVLSSSLNTKDTVEQTSSDNIALHSVKRADPCNAAIDDWVCPICSKSLPPQLLSFNKLLNKHVDQCLGLTERVSLSNQPNHSAGKRDHKKRKYTGDESQNSLKKFFKTV